MMKRIADAQIDQDRTSMHKEAREVRVRGDVRVLYSAEITNCC